MAIRLNSHELISGRLPVSQSVAEASAEFCGLPAAFALTHLVKSFLYGLTPQDPLSIVLATVGLMSVTALAGFIPARRATRVDPVVALRFE